MGVRALIYFEIVNTIALLIGLLAVNITKPGVGVNLPMGETSEIAAAPQTGDQILLHAFPESVIRAMAEGNVLQIVVFVGNCLATVVIAKWEGEFVEASDRELEVAAARGEI